MDFPGEEVADILIGLGITHVVWLPDSAIGPWEKALDRPGTLELVRVCREGEAWAIAAGLLLGGRRPLVMIQNTGLFESGDALRNVLFDLKLPIVAIVGHRGSLTPGWPDTARDFAAPVLDAWGIDYRRVATEEDKPQLAAHLANCLKAERPGVVLLAE